MIDLRDFEKEYQAAFQAHDRACKKRKKFPTRPDRWASTEDMGAILDAGVGLAKLTQVMAGILFALVLSYPKDSEDGRK